MYRLHSNYSLESLESLLSTHFMTPPVLSHAAIALPPTKVKVDDAPVQFTPTITSAYQRQRQESLGSGSAASAANARTAAHFPSSGNTSNTSLSSRPFPSRPALSTDIGVGTSPLTSAPIRTALPHSPTASSPPSDPHSPNRPATLHLHSSNSSISSSPRPRRISALNPGTSSDHHLGGGGTGGVSNASPRLVFGGYGKDVGDLPFAVGLGSGRTSGSMDRTRKESLLGGSNTAVSSSIYFKVGLACRKRLMLRPMILIGSSTVVLLFHVCTFWGPSTLYHFYSPLQVWNCCVVPIFPLVISPP